MTQPAPAPPHDCPNCTCPTRQTDTAWIYSETENGYTQRRVDDLDWIRTMPTVAPLAPAVLAIGIASAALTLSAIALAIHLLTAA